MATDEIAAQRPPLPPPNPLLGATVDDEPAVPLVATCGATLTDPVTPSVTHVCSRVDDHRSSPVDQHWDRATDMTWPVGSAAPGQGVVTNVQGRIIGVRGGYLATAGDDYLRKKISDMRVLISRAQSNIANWQTQLDDALAEADRRWGSTDGH